MEARPLAPFDAVAGYELANAIRLQMDNPYRVDQIPEFAFLVSQISGEEPYARGADVDVPAAVLEILPEDAVLARSFTAKWGVTAFARSDRGSILIETRPRSTSVRACARSDVLAETLVREVVDRVPERDLDGQVEVGMWHLGDNQRPICQDRHLEAPMWEDIEPNYARSVRRDLERLMMAQPPEHGAKLLLWHGEPGTGKTTALRALLRSWESWCTGQYITDPERLFAYPGYIAEVLSRPTDTVRGPTLDDAGESEARWRLLIAEDTDEYLRTSARRDAGAGLGRLLNLADGMLGQGLNCLILVTTNEEITRLHPALVRPGRCLARVEFTKLSQVEVAEQLPEDTGDPGKSLTLAELLELRGDLARIGDKQSEEPAGLYL